MMSPEIQQKGFNEDILKSQFEKITAIKIETIENGLRSAGNETVFSAGLGFALAVINNQNQNQNQNQNNKEIIK